MPEHAYGRGLRLILVGFKSKSFAESPNSLFLFPTLGLWCSAADLQVREFRGCRSCTQNTLRVKRPEGEKQLMCVCVCTAHNHYTHTLFTAQTPPLHSLLLVKRHWPPQYKFSLPVAVKLLGAIYRHGLQLKSP